MGRSVKNPSVAKRQWITARNSLMTLGDEGKEELKRIEEAYKPKQLFAIEKQSPPAAQSIVEMLRTMRTARDDIVRAKQLARQQEKKLAREALAEGRPVRTVRVGRKGRIVREGDVEGIKYRIRTVPIHDGAGKVVSHGFQIKILKSKRQIKPMRGAPKLYTHPDTFKIFPAKDVRVRAAGEQQIMTGLDATEIRARRIINAAIIWYGEHGIRLAEKRFVMTPARKAKHAKIKETRKRAREKRPFEVMEEEREAHLEKRRRQEAAAQKHGVKTRRPKATRGVKRGLGVIEAEVFGGRARTPKKALKGNPLGLGSPYAKQAEQSARKYKQEMVKWEQSMSTSRPNYGALMSAYDWLENVRGNLSLDEQKDTARRVQEKKAELRDVIVALMGGQELYEAEYAVRNPKKKKSKKKSGKRK